MKYKKFVFLMRNIENIEKLKIFNIYKKKKIFN